MLQRLRQDGEVVMISDDQGNKVAVTPQSEAWIVDWPGGGLVWNRPIAVLVEQDEEINRVPIFDWTRIAQVGLLIVAVRALSKYRKRLRQPRRNEHE